MPLVAVCLIPAYKLLESLPSTREAGLRLGLVTHAVMTRALVWAVENLHAESAS